MVKVQRLMKKSRGRTPNLMIPQGISPIIIPGSKEDHESTRESVNVLNGPDTSIRAGKGIDADLPISVTPQEGERTILSSISTKDKNVIEERMDADLANNEMVSAFDNFICNNLKKIRLSSSSGVMESLWIPSSSSALLGDEDFDGWCHHQPAAKKRRLTATQVEFLERSFEVENKLDSDRKLQLAKQLGLQPRQVAIWFQNRRARSKNKQLEKDYDLLRASFAKLKADFDQLLKEKDDLQNEVVILKEKLLAREKGIVNSSDDEPRNPNSDTSHVPSLACKQEEACSGKTDVFESNSPCFTDGNGHHSSFMEPADSTNVFEPDHQSDFSQDEDDDPNLPLFFPKFDCYYDAPVGSCNSSLPVEDQWFWSSLY
ncbi:hypothetical protein V6N11_030798 [Hibiscus sabdariffa]|uniref:Homeobox-leucine zipper protein n=1 Tax=Hibiscus sabdariffa TaxID=183260 RepID=A0ABR2AH85_9ROSI